MRRLDDRELQAEALRDFDARQLAGEVQQLQHQLDDEIKAESGRFPSVVGARRRQRAVRSVASRRIVSQHVRHHGCSPFS